MKYENINCPVKKNFEIRDYNEVKKTNITAP